MKSGRPILLTVAGAAFLWLPQTASAQAYRDHSCASPNNVAPYGYYGDGYYAPSPDYGPYASAPGRYAYTDRAYGPPGGYVGYSAPYSGDAYGGYPAYRDPYTYDRYGYGNGYLSGYSGRHQGGYNQYATPHGVHEDHVRRRVNLFPFPHVDRRVVHHTHR